MQTRRVKRVIGAKLKPLIATWEPVKEALNVTTFQAIAFVEQTCERLGVELYNEDEMTGLWVLCGEQSGEMIYKLGCSDYAHSVANDEVPTDPGKWESSLRVTPADFQAILGVANAIASDGEASTIKLSRERAASADAIAVLAEARRQDGHARVDKDADRRATEIEYEMLKAKHEELLAEGLGRIQELAGKVPHVFARLICEAALGVPNENNIFRPAEKDREAVMRLYPDLPAAILADLARREKRANGVESQLPCVDGFVKLCDWIERYAHFHSVPGWKFTSGEDSHIMHAFFNYHEDSFGHEIGNAAQLVYNGIPLYEYDPLSRQYVVVPFTHEDYIYLSKKGEHCDYGPRSSFPYWAKKYFIRQQHLDAHKIFFAGIEVGDSVQKVEILRTAFRHHIGFLQPNANEIEGADRHVKAKSLQREAAQARWAPLKTVRDRTIDAYRAGKSGWKSRADAGRKLQHQVIAWAKDAGMPLSPENALETIDKWLKESEQSNG